MLRRTNITLNRAYAGAILLAAIAFGNAAEAEAPVILDRVFLYLPEHELTERMANQTNFLAYITEVSKSLETAISTAPAGGPVSVGLIVTVRPGRESKIWFSLLAGELSREQRDHIANVLEAIRPAEVRSGIVPFAFALRLWGAQEPVESLPFSPEWLPYADGNTEITEVIGRAWK
jgi:hypothetical protein